MLDCDVVARKYTYRGQVTIRSHPDLKEIALEISVYIIIIEAIGNAASYKNALVSNA